MAARSGGRSSLELTLRLLASTLLWLFAAFEVLAGLNRGGLLDIVIGVLVGIWAYKVARPRPKKTQENRS